MKRTNKPTLVKTFRLPPALIEDMERVLFFTREGEKPKYVSMTNFIIVAMEKLIREERRVIENDGVVWEHLKPDFKQSMEE